METDSMEEKEKRKITKFQREGKEVSNWVKNSKVISSLFN